MKRLGLIVNPIAGLGGSVGLKGTDGVASEALRRGAVPRSGERARQALEPLLPCREELEILTWPGDMGGTLAQELGFSCRLLPDAPQGDTAREDTIRLARALAEAHTDLILFAGGDGTARDLYTALGTQPLVLGIPAGVKIYSPVFARTPRSAGLLALRVLNGQAPATREEEVLDVDEDLYRREIISTRLYGYLRIPLEQRLTQCRKSPTPPSEREAIDAIAHQVTADMRPDTNYLIGAGTTPRGVMERLGLPNTLIGVDLVRDGQLIARDLSERDILAHLQDGRPVKLAVTVTGGQGCLFGRGNQQLTPQVLRQIGKENILILATKQKLAQLAGRPLLADTFDPQLNRALSGYYRAICGWGEFTMCQVSDG